MGKKKSGRRQESFQDIFARAAKEIKPHDGLISFSFKYLNNIEKFRCYGLDSGYYRGLLERIKQLSSWKTLDFRQSQSKSLRAHRIDWADPGVTEKGFGIKGGEEFDDEAYQFQISQSEYGRVYGFLLDTVFYIVWLDPDHKPYQ